MRNPFLPSSGGGAVESDRELAERAASSAALDRMTGRVQAIVPARTGLAPASGTRMIRESMLEVVENRWRDDDTSVHLIVGNSLLVSVRGTIPRFWFLHLGPTPLPFVSLSHLVRRHPTVRGQEPWRPTKRLML